jgi:hypothetical protein
MKTEKYNEMLISFDADFSLAVHGDTQLSEMEKLIKEGNERLLKDIELLSELAFNIRYGKVEIVEIH